MVVSVGRQFCAYQRSLKSLSDPSPIEVNGLTGLLEQWFNRFLRARWRPDLCRRVSERSVRESLVAAHRGPHYAGRNGKRWLHGPGLARTLKRGLATNAECNRGVDIQSSLDYWLMSAYFALNAVPPWVFIKSSTDKTIAEIYPTCSAQQPLCPRYPVDFKRGSFAGWALLRRAEQYCAEDYSQRPGWTPFAGGIEPSWTITWVPIGVIRLNSSEANIGIRMQPWLAGCTGTDGLP
jgi:hypothetical protein